MQKLLHHDGKDADNERDDADTLDEDRSEKHVCLDLARRLGLPGDPFDRCRADFAQSQTDAENRKTRTETCAYVGRGTS